MASHAPAFPLPFDRLLVANRGEIAIRILRAAAEMGLATVAVAPEDDARCLHVRAADECVILPGAGASAYLNTDTLIATAVAESAGAIHPGYGFVSENAGFAAACVQAGVTFVGPAPETLALLGDKAAARSLAAELGVPLIPGTDGTASLAEIAAFFDSAAGGGDIMLKAVAGGGGRGMRRVRDRGDLDAAYARCQSEAQAAFGNGAVYAEAFLARARHVEVQILGDGATVVHLGERDCSLQRRNQKLLEIAPAPFLDPAIRDALYTAALTLARAGAYRGAGTIEFLVWRDGTGADRFAFIEANPRLQVEHTVTEAVTGVDLVKAQIALAGGASLEDLGLSHSPVPSGFAIQARINTEVLDATGTARPKGGTVSAYDLPNGPGVRVDGHGYTGYTTHPGFDPLLAKIITHSPSPDFADAVARAARALSETRIAGVETTVPLLRAVLAHPAFGGYDVHTRFIEEEAAGLISAAATLAGMDGFFQTSPAPQSDMPQAVAAPAGTEAVRAPMQGTLASFDVDTGATVRAGEPLAILEAMKMEHVITAPVSGIIRSLIAVPGATIEEGAPLAFIEAADVAPDTAAQTQHLDPDHIRADLAHVRERHAYGLDETRAEAVAKRRKTGGRTARENIADLCDPGSFIEYGALAVAAQRRRRDVQDLIERTPADGLIGGFGRINGAQFSDDVARAMVLSYDYTVLAGTQGYFNHKKTDRLLHLAEDWRAPVVFFTEGGGGRPGDTDANTVAGLDVPSFASYARLSGLAPRIAIASGRCFAGNAALFGCSDIAIATQNSTIGMGGPAMIEGGGLGVFRPEEVGPIDMQTRNGVVDVAVADEADAVATAKQALSYFQGPIADWTCADQRLLRHAIPENRLRVYDIRTLITTLADEGSVLELRPHFAVGMITALIRIEGRPFGLMANNPQHLAGAIDSDGADKAARFLQLCDAFDLPVVSLCDTPGIMVGPDAEKTALVRHAARLFVTAASVTIPIFAIVLRKGYGLGAQTMTGGGFHESVFTIAWPSGEFGGMGLEGAVRLGYRRELEEAGDAAAQQALFEQLVARHYEIGKATNMASYLEIDAVIDPMETRAWVLRGLRSVPSVPPRTGKKRPFIDTW